MPDLANTLIGGRYRLERKLGAGGMGEVWAATDTRLARQVAVKILRSSLAADPAVRLRFESEARSAARLHHPNVVAVFDAGADTGDGDGGPAQLWLVMERLPGETLVDSERRGELPAADVRAVAVDVLAGLAAAHDAKLVHRDIKPSNLLRATDGTWKIADFGIAKPLDTPADLTTTGATIGTPSYLSPEQLEGRPATPASDLWALGVVLYEALAGRKPFVGETPFAVAHAVRIGQPQPIVSIRPDIDPALATTIGSALSKDPADRPRNASTMAAMLAGAAASTALPVGVPEMVPVAGAGMTQPLAPVLAPASTSSAPAAAGGGGGGRRFLGWLTAGVIVVAAVLIALAANGSFSGSGSPTKPPATTSPSTAAGASTVPSSSTPNTSASSATTTTTSSSTTAATTTTAPTTTGPTTTATSAPSTTSTTGPTTTATTSPRTTAPTTTKAKVTIKTKATTKPKGKAESKHKTGQPSPPIPEPNDA